MLFLREFFEKLDFEKNQQTTKTHAKFPSRQIATGVLTKRFKFFLCLDMTYDYKCADPGVMRRFAPPHLGHPCLYMHVSYLCHDRHINIVPIIKTPRLQLMGEGAHLSFFEERKIEHAALGFQ